MLIAFLALIALVTGCSAIFHTSLEPILGTLFAPIAWLLGVKFHDCRTIGNLLGTRLVLNEFVAFQQLGPMKPSLDPHSFTIATYALCGFANLSSIAIQIGGIGALAPSRKSDLARLGLKARGCRDHGEFHVGLHRGHAFVMHEAVAYIRDVTGREPRIAVVLGSGLGAFADELADPIASPTREFPAGLHPPPLGIRASWFLANWASWMSPCMAGPRSSLRRLHAAQVTMGVRVLHRLGVRSRGIHQCRRRHQSVVSARVRWC